MQHIAAWLLLMISLAKPHAAPQLPPKPFESFAIPSAGGSPAKISGWFLPAKSPRGTLFMCHGYGQSKEIWLPYNWIRENENWNIVCFDFREHGESTHHLTHVCTLGYD